MDLNSVQPARARVHLRRSLDNDPSFGIARVYNATVAEGLTTAQRERPLRTMGCRSGRPSHCCAKPFEPDFSRFGWFQRSLTT